MKVRTKVKLLSFNNTTKTPDDCDPSKNYWSLIGEEGTIVKPLNECSRFLVKIDNADKLTGLHCHNEIKNSLWILKSDLEVVND
jgi:hypothetical protein